MNFKETIDFDSNEEAEFYLYLEQLKEQGYIIEFAYNSKSFYLSEPVLYKWNEKLKTKTKERTSTLLQEHSYRPDFKIMWSPKAEGIFFTELESGKKLGDTPFIAQKNCSVVEIKSSFDYKNMTRLTIINAKWMWDKYGIYVQKITPTGKSNCLFAKTFTPTKCLLTKKTKQQRKFRYPVKTLEQYVQSKIC